MAMNGDILGTAIGQAFYDAIPASVLECMSETARVAMCNTLIANSKIIAKCTIAHITANAKVTVAAGILVSTEGTAVAQTGQTTSTGTGTIA